MPQDNECETLYIMVTRDKYELPLAVAGNAQELSRLTHYPVGTIHTYISKKIGTFYRVRIPKDV